MLSEITPLNQESTSSKQSSAPKDNLNKFQIVSYTTKLAALTVQLNATSTSYNYPTGKEPPSKRRRHLDDTTVVQGYKYQTYSRQTELIITRPLINFGPGELG